jgi:nitrogen fixation protein NifX
MSGQDKLSRELALRIGLAARVLPDTDAKTVFKLLIDTIGLPITEDKLADINPVTLKAGLSGTFSNIEDTLLQKLLQILKQPVEIETNQNLNVQAYNEGDMPGSVRIACASDDGINVDGHFGTCNQFLIYQVSGDESRLIEARDTAIPEGLEVDDKNLFRAELIQDCKVLYIKLPSIETINEIISKLQTVIAGTPPPWLAKAMGIEASERFKFEREATG